MSDDGGEPVSPSAASIPAMRERGSWRPAVAGVTTLGAPVGLGVLHPLFGEAVAGGEGVLAITIIAVALFGSQALSDRAFRLLRWFANRPEPSAPGGK